MLDNVTNPMDYAGGMASTMMRATRFVTEGIAGFAVTGRCASAVNAHDPGWV